MSESELIQFVQDLVQIPSVNGEHGETAVAKRVAQEAEKLGLESELCGVENDRLNIVVKAKLGNGSESEKLFLFIGHTDTVALGGGEDHHLWKHKPLSATIEENKMYGRGTADNKSGIACALYAMAKLKQESKLNGTVLLAGVVDEESGAQSTIGAKHLIEKKIITGSKGAIYVEPNRNVTIGHRGLIRLKIEVKGEAIHSGSSKWCSQQRGQNATMALVHILHMVEQHQWPLDLHDSFPGLRLTITPGTMFQGGSFESVVPDNAYALIDIRTMPDTKHEELIGKIRTIAEEVINQRNEKHKVTSGAKLSFTLTVKNSLPHACLEGGATHPLAQACVKSLKHLFGEKTPIQVGGCGPANEGHILMEAGIPTICGFGPLGAGMHSVNEYIEVPSLMETVNLYAKIVEEYNS